MRRRLRSSQFVTACALGACLALSAKTWALINPNFTPLHLIEQSDAIVHLSLTPGENDETIAGRVVKVFKGPDKAPKDAVRVALDEMPEDEAADLLDLVRKEPGLLALLFIREGDDGENTIYLHTAGQWAKLARDEEGFKGETTKTEMEPTWAGGTDMLARAVDYTLKDPAPDFPVAHGIAWKTRQPVVKLEGNVRAAIPVRINRGPVSWLHLAADSGDRLLRCERGQFEMKDVTASTGLAAKSAVACWADVQPDGRLDLISWDGRSLTLWTQNAEGRFQSHPVETGDHLQQGCRSLAILDTGDKKGRPAILAGTSGWPILFLPEGDLAYRAAPLVADAEFPVSKTGESVACLVADFDGDGHADILQMGGRSGLLHRGRGDGTFLAPAPTAAAAGRDAAPFLGDFDADGLLDVFCPSLDGCRLWHQIKPGEFVERLDKSGETAYQCAAGAVGGMTCDFNNDGRQDVLVLYNNIGPQLYFNRGFRSFGYSLELMPTAQTHDGDIRQQTGCMGDFNGDGVQDLALVFKDGQVFLFFQDPGEKPPHALTVALDPAAGYAGPLTVSDFDEDRCRGAWAVGPAVEAFVARREAGPVTLRWRMPDGRAKDKEIVLERQSVHLSLAPRVARAP